MTSKEEQIAANQRIVALSRQVTEMERKLQSSGILAGAANRRAALISQIVAARPDIWNRADLTDFTNTQLERLALQLNPGAFMANGAVVNCDEEEELPSAWRERYPSLT